MVSIGFVSDSQQMKLYDYVEQVFGFLLLLGQLVKPWSAKNKSDILS